MAQAVARGLLAAKRPGSIINVSSQMGHVGAAGRTVYCATKHAMEGLTKAMAVELAPHSIRVNSLGADLHRDPDDAALLPEPGLPQRGARQDQARPARPLEDLMGAIVFLASDASALMTGTSLVIDGGWTAE